MLFCPPTPAGALAKSLKRVLEAEAKSTGLMVKVVERAGRKLRHQVPGLQCSVDCSNQRCFLHQTGGKGDCRREGCVYRGRCLTCEASGPKTRPVEGRDGEVTIQEVEERAGGSLPPTLGSPGSVLLYAAASTWTPWRTPRAMQIMHL